MIAVVLVGGEGTRLRPLTATRPKPMLPIGGRPFLEHLIDRLAEGGVERVILSCGYLPDSIPEHFGAGRPGGPAIEYVLEDEPLGTAGAIRHAALGRVSGPFIALNGDVLDELDLRELVSAHERAGARATITLVEVDDPTRFGLVQTDAADRVEAFLEKPSRAWVDRTPGPYFINAGAYVLDPSVLELIPSGRSVSIEREVFPRLVGAGLCAWRSSGYWNDIGTPQTYLAANRHAVRSGDGSGEARVAADAQVHPDAVLVGSVVVGSRARIGAGARVGGESALGERAEVGDGATVTASVVLEDAVIGAGARLVEAIVGEGATVAAGAEPAPGTVVAPGGSWPEVAAAGDGHG